MSIEKIAQENNNKMKQVAEFSNAISQLVAGFEVEVDGNE